MFWNAFVWGLGVSCGGSIALIGFVLTLWTLQWATGRADQLARATKVNELSLAAVQAIAASMKETEMPQSRKDSTDEPRKEVGCDDN